MANGKKSTLITLVILAGMFIQVVYAFLDNRETPGKIAVKFSKAYFMLDESMADYLCKNLKSDENSNIVHRYIDQKIQNSQTRGFNKSYNKSTIYNIRTHTISTGEKSAQVRITGDRKKCINPAFAVIGKIFQIGKTYRLDKTINLVNESGKWKVCDKI